MYHWRFPRNYSKFSKKDLAFEVTLEDKVNKLKLEMAELAKQDEKITVKQALEIITNKPEYSSVRENYILQSAIDRLKLANVEHYRVVNYLPRIYMSSAKAPLYLPKSI